MPEVKEANNKDGYAKVGVMENGGHKKQGNQS
jgi:hypothetical protein